MTSILVALFVRFYPRPEICLFIGVFLAAPFGILLRWWYSTIDNAQAVGEGAVSLLLAGFALFFIIPMGATEKANISALSDLPTNAISAIKVSEEYGTVIRRTIDDPVSLAAFVVAARDLRSRFPSKRLRNETAQKWRVTVILKDGRRYVLEWTHRSRTPNAVFGTFFEVTPTSKRHCGDFLSNSLRVWFDNTFLDDSGT